MSSVALESHRWERRRWWGLVVLVFIVQLALIFALGDVSLPKPGPPAPGFTLRLAGDASAEALRLQDPTLFVLPHPQEFPGRTQMAPPRPQFQAFTWSEPTNHLLPPADQPAAAFNRFVQTNDFSLRLPPASPEPQLTIPNLPALDLTADQSSFQLEGGLAHRQLITPFHLPSWPNSEILTNSVVRIAVDADGIPRSWTLLTGSGYAPADQYALDQAKAARFESLNRGPAGPGAEAATDLSWGRIVFQWHTVPPQPTNAPAVSP